jgi:hypothetical protein
VCNVFTGAAGDSALLATAKTDGNVERTSTRTWAKSHSYDAEKLFRKLFHDDIKYLLSMERLWERRRPPIPLEWGKLPDAGKNLFISKYHLFLILFLHYKLDFMKCQATIKIITLLNLFFYKKCSF